MKFKIFSLLFTTFTLVMNAQNPQNLDKKQSSLVTISSLTAIGNLEDLKLELNKALDSGLTINEIKEVLVQLYAYCGFPRSLNAINTFKTVLDERKSKGINDIEGKKITVENNVEDKYEQGRKTLETLSKTPQSKPAKGFGEFAPQIDAFLKEHLFADIFVSDVLTYQQRELVTISALASISGVEGQLQSHIGIGKNTGITENQLSEMADLIDKNISVVQGNTIRKIINKPSKKVLKDDLIVRISEIEVVSGFLDEYKSILKEEAATSVSIEPGVIAIFPMYQKENQNHVRIIEIYVNQNAYQKHLKTTHFLKYKNSTLKMVKNLKLVDMKHEDSQSMQEIFTKAKQVKSLE